MNDKTLRLKLRRIAIEKAVPCEGCGFEHRCSTEGCAIIRQALERLARETPPKLELLEMIAEKTEIALDLLSAERQRQDALWGDQSENHPFEWLGILGEEYGELCEAINETYFQNATHPERGGYEKIIREATHVAAVAVAIIEAMNARLQAEGGGK